MENNTMRKLAGLNTVNEAVSEVALLKEIKKAMKIIDKIRRDKTRTADEVYTADVAKELKAMKNDLDEVLFYINSIKGNF